MSGFTVTLIDGWLPILSPDKLLTMEDVARVREAFDNASKVIVMSEPVRVEDYRTKVDGDV